ncbi:hypothetical protein CMQ_3760 [Grosmannia clavigera kw1407]|uniref:Cell wall protein n=1 Tax=Grosmannia clavigera (strain kw1407 / UAMH 11150) TaxID=655863 RepID=F0X9V0_GROCL|nr:uncharacterized protein CMQ_3760 [Grosmannia clavigera kw1407]EFX05691.1 hypothetical protein CMQ_3760 [Grosmannia clavigera kw1407]
MSSKILFLSALVAFVEARFGQEQVPVAAISALTNRGKAGDAGTLSGQVPGVLLAGANACAKLTLADNIVSTLGSTSDVLSAAAGLVAAEKNFNPFVVSVPSLCSDPTLPTTAALRGIVPLVDPSVGGADTENAKSKTSLTTPFSADGKSVADVASANGFTNFTSQGTDGSTSSASSATAPSNVGSSGSSSSSTAASAATNSSSSATASSASSSSTSISSSVASSNSSSTGATVNGVQQSSISGLDFGLCVPTMKFEAGLNGRKDTESTFQAIDSLVNKGQQEALNPNIITNRICDQLTNVCNANQAAKDACAAAKTKISSLGTKDVTTADAWNTALGFAGTNTNPDNAPQTGLVGHS